MLSSAFCSKLSKHTNHSSVPFLIQTRGMASKAAAETMTKALSEAVLQNPGRTIAAVSGAVTSVIGTAVSITYDSSQKQRDRDFEAEQRQQDRDLQEAISKSQIESNAEIEKSKIVESQLNREANYAIMNRNSLEKAEEKKHTMLITKDFITRKTKKPY